MVDKHAFAQYLYANIDGFMPNGRVTARAVEWVETVVKELGPGAIDQLLVALTRSVASHPASAASQRVLDLFLHLAPERTHAIWGLVVEQIQGAREQARTQMEQRRLEERRQREEEAKESQVRADRAAVREQVLDLMRHREFDRARLLYEQKCSAWWPQHEFESAERTAHDEHKAADEAKARADEAASAEQRAAEEKRREAELRQARERAARIASWEGVVRARGIKRLTHVTRIQNLGSILRHGLFPVTRHHELPDAPIRNDAARFDGRLSAVSLSVTHPNDALFCRWHAYDYSGDTWIVLSIRPEVMWELPCLLFGHNAAFRGGTGVLACNSTPDATAFESLFGEPEKGPSRVAMGLNSADTTNPQAEVMIDAIIGVKYFQSVSVRATKDLPNTREIIAGVGSAIELLVEPTLYDMRSYAQKSRAVPPKPSSQFSNYDLDEDIPF